MGNCNKTRKYEQLCCVCIGAMHMYTCTRVQSRFVLLGGGVMVGVQRSKKDQRKIKGRSKKPLMVILDITPVQIISQP